MRQKRAKSYRKQMLVYNHTFKFREPYQVIVDDTLVVKCEQSSFDLQKGLARTIQAEVKPMITQCCMQELYKLNNQPAIELARTFERRRCNHPPSDPLPPHECIKSIVIIKGQNKHRYVVATENEKLRWSLRKIPGIPLIYMNRSVMVMEPLSKASAEVNNNKEQSKLTGGLNDIGGGEKQESEGQTSKKRKGPKEPNPLSIKKKKTDQSKQEKKEDTDEQKKKRKRKHKKSSNEDIEEPQEEGEQDESASREIKDETTEISKESEDVSKEDHE